MAIGTFLEASIADRREFYNDSVNANNVRIERPPTSWSRGCSASSRGRC